MLWTELQDELLCGEVMLVQPYSYKSGTRVRGNAWTRIADSLNLIEEPVLCESTVSQRTL